MDEITISLDDSPIISQPTPLMIGDQPPVVVQENFVGGRSATIQIGTVETLPAGSEAYVQNVGTETDAVFNMGIPCGETGAAGQAGLNGQDGTPATIQIGTVSTGLPDTNASVTNVGTSSAAVLDFTIPRGSQGEQGLRGVAGEDGVSPIAYVTQTSTGATIHIEDAQNVTDAVITNGTDGTDGQAATITVGSTTTGAAGTSASVVNSGTSSAAVLDFVIPRGDTGAAGADGNDGQAATITVGSTTTGAAGTSASVVNSGTSSAAVLDFIIPKGDTGATGATPTPTSIAISSYITMRSGFSNVYSYAYQFGKLMIVQLLVKSNSNFTSTQVKVGDIASAYYPANAINYSCSLGTDEWSTKGVGYLYMSSVNGEITIADYNNSGCKCAKINIAYIIN